VPEGVPPVSPPSPESPEPPEPPEPPRSSDPPRSTPDPAAPCDSEPPDAASPAEPPEAEPSHAPVAPNKQSTTTDPLIELKARMSRCSCSHAVAARSTAPKGGSRLSDGCGAHGAHGVGTVSRGGVYTLTGTACSDEAFVHRGQWAHVSPTAVSFANGHRAGAGVARSVSVSRSPVASRTTEGASRCGRRRERGAACRTNALAASRGAGLPLPRAARERVELTAAAHARRRPREHGFGEDRGRAGAAEHPRVGAARRIPPSPQRLPRRAGVLVSGCPHSPVLAPSGLRAVGLPQRPCSPFGLRAAGGDAHSRGGERSGDGCESLRRLGHDERLREPEHPVAEAREVAVAASVRDTPTCVIAAVHLNDEARGGSEKVRGAAQLPLRSEYLLELEYALDATTGSAVLHSRVTQ
jgi:hypothetical protein